MTETENTESGKLSGPELSGDFVARVRVEKPDIIPNARSVGVEIERAR